MSRSVFAKDAAFPTASSASTLSSTVRSRFAGLIRSACLENAYAKLGVHTRTAAVAAAFVNAR